MNAVAENKLINNEIIDLYEFIDTNGNGVFDNDEDNTGHELGDKSFKILCLLQLRHGRSDGP